MGVIKKMFYRGNILGKQRHQHFFLDMEENIHIHYRDLRIELSRGEFEDVCDAFRNSRRNYKPSSMKKITRTAKLPNANQDDVRIWTESLLQARCQIPPAAIFAGGMYGWISFSLPATTSSCSMRLNSAR